MNNIGRILWNLPVSLRKLFKKLENNSKKLINKEWSYKFNEICLNARISKKVVKAMSYLNSLTTKNFLTNNMFFCLCIL